MRILVATPWLHPEGGGLERYADALARESVRRGHEITLVGHSRRPVHEEEDGLRRIGLPPRFTLSNTPLDPAMGRLVGRLLREESHDLVSVHTPVPGVAELAALAARRRRVPYAVTYHAGRLEAGSPLLQAFAWIHRATGESLLLSGACARVAVSPFVAHHVFKRRSWVLVPPGVDAARFRPEGAPVPGRVLFVGPLDRAYRWKGSHVLLEAFRRLAARRDDATLRFVGQGDLLDAFRAKVQDMGLRERVSFAGRVAEEALPREYARAHLVALPSLSHAESFGMVLAEANACARPVIGSRVGGIPHFVREGDNGLLVEPGDTEGLARAMARLLDNPREASDMGTRGRRRVKDEHRWPDAAERTMAAFELAAAQHRTKHAPRVAAPAKRAPR